MQLETIVNTSRDVAATRSRLEKRRLISACLAAAPADRLSLAVHYLAGNLPQGKIGLGPALFRELKAIEPRSDATLTLAEADAAFTAFAQCRGAGSKQARLDVLGQLLARATDAEQDYLKRLALGELRQGALESALIDGIAVAAGIDAAQVRRAVMLADSLATVADAAMNGSAPALERFRLRPLRPVRPMLAQPAGTMVEAIDELGTAALDYKLDGARIQVHRVGTTVKIFSRQLNDVTDSLPEVVEHVRALPTRELILDGEVLALRPDGRPHPFQATMRRFGRKTDVASMREQLPLSAFFFDCIYREGELLDQPLGERRAQLVEEAGPNLVTPGLVTADPAEAGAFLTSALEAGHEGVMAKSLDSLYAAGNRGGDWLKIKQAHTLDLVVLAAEWGSGRRKGWLSNLHLGARDPAGGFLMLGKTFKGLTDRLLKWQTAQLLQREIGREAQVVHVRPELVVEIALNDIQASPQYPAGLALRFARVKRYRQDKTASEADTIGAVRDLYRQQTGLAPPAAGAPSAKP